MSVILPWHKTLASCLVDENLCVTEFSSNFTSFFGLEAEEIKHKPLSEFFDSGEELIPNDKKSSGEQQHLMAYHHPSGAFMVLQVNASFVDGEKHNVFLFSNVTESVLSQGESSEKEKELRLVLDTIDEVVILTSIDGTVNNVNFKAEQIYGEFSPGQNIRGYLRGTEDEGLSELIQHVLSTFTPVTKEQYVLSMHRTVNVSVFPAFGSKDDLRRLVVTEKDLTHERLLELEVLQQQGVLQDQLAELQELYKEKDDWLSTISHELRTPLTSMVSSAELIRDFTDDDPEARKEFASIIVTEGHRLKSMIDDLLDVSKMENRRMGLTLEKEDLITIVKQSILTLSPLLQQKNLLVDIKSVEKSVFMSLDKTKTLRVFINLLSNSIKFLDDGANNILIFVDKTEDEIVVTVEDDGIGIPEKNRLNVFGRFVQLHDDLIKDKPKGTGLGLAICKNIVEAMGGTIRCVEPRELKGASFMMRFASSGKE